MTTAATFAKRGVALCAPLALLAPLAASASVILAQPNLTSLTSGLITYWPLDGNTTNWTSNTTQDLSGQGNTGTLASMSTTTSPTIGKVGQALKFNGTNSYVSSTNSFANPQLFTLSVWFKTSSAGGHKILSLEDAQTGQGSSSSDRALYIGTDGKLYFLIWNGSAQTIVSTGTVTDNKWHFASVTYNAGNSTLYMDGAVVGSKSATAQTYTGYWRLGSYLSPGVWPNAANGYFQGALDDVRIYNRALSAQEVALLYAAGQAQIAPANTTTLANGLIAYWPLDGSTTNWATNKTSDVGTSGATGAFVSMSTSTSPHTGKIGGALYFNGSGQRITATALSGESSTALTYSEWIKSPAPGVGATGVAFVRSWSPWNHLSPSGSGGDLTVDTTAGVTDLGSTGVSINDGKWHLLTGTWDGTTMRLYIDGVFNVSAAKSGTLLTGGQNPIIGNSSDLVHPFNGYLDDIRVYNRALSAQEVAQLYALGATTLASANTTTLSSGLVGYWPLDGNTINWATNTFKDVIGGNNATSTGLSTTTAPVIGKIGQALQFNGSSYMSLGNILNPGLNNFSWGTWFKTSSSADQGLIAKSLFGSQDSRWFLILNDGGNTIGCSVVKAGNVPQNAAITSPSYNDGKWHHAMCVANRTGNLVLYMDGVSKATVDISSLSAQNISTSDCLEIGGYNNASGNCSTNLHFIGSLDDVRIYNRALSAQEVQQLYLTGK